MLVPGFFAPETLEVQFFSSLHVYGRVPTPESTPEVSCQCQPSGGLTALRRLENCRNHKTDRQLGHRDLNWPRQSAPATSMVFESRNQCARLSEHQVGECQAKRPAKPRLCRR